MAQQKLLPKKTYTTPHLIVHGDVETITQQAPLGGNPNNPSNPHHASHRLRVGAVVGAGIGIAVLGSGGSAASGASGLFS